MRECPSKWPQTVQNGLKLCKMVQNGQFLLIKNGITHNDSMMGQVLVKTLLETDLQDKISVGTAVA